MITQSPIQNEGFGHSQLLIDLKVASFDDSYYLSPAKHASVLTSHASLTNCKLANVTLDYNIKLHATNDESLHGATLYKQLVTSLVCLTVTCPDISHAVHILSQFIYSLHPVHFKYCSLHLALSQGHTFMDFSSLRPVMLS